MENRLAKMAFTRPNFNKLLFMRSSNSNRLIVGISGASGITYGIKALVQARDAGLETHLVVTKAAHMTRAYETNFSANELRDLADTSYPIDNVGAKIASGSFSTEGMIIAPCSVRTLAAISLGLNDNLLTRAADVTLKERRPLILLVRETPLTLAHLRAMTLVTEMGGIIMPPMPAFYLLPETIEAMVNSTVSHALELLNIEMPNRSRWAGLHRSAQPEFNKQK
jgi:4-hydroxy-3-polyprenylbenzoate decarboxylase